MVAALLVFTQAGQAQSNNNVNEPQAARERLIEQLNRLRQHKDDTGTQSPFVPPLPTRKKQPGSQAQETETQTQPPLPVNSEADRLIAPLLIFHFAGTQPSDPGVRAVRNLLQEGAIAGVVITHNNVSTRAQLKELLKFLSYTGAGKQRPIIAANETGGNSESLPSEPGFHTPRQREVAQRKDPQYAYSTYQTMGTNLAAMGFNMNFGPWLSVAAPTSEDVESFDSNPLQAAVFAKTFLMGHKEAGVLATPLITPVEGESLALKALLVSFPNTAVAIAGHDNGAAAVLQITSALHGARFCFVNAKVGYEGAAVIAHLKKGCDSIILPLLADKPEAIRLRIGQAVSDALARNVLEAKVLQASAQRVEALRAGFDQ